VLYNSSVTMLALFAAVSFVAPAPALPPLPIPTSIFAQQGEDYSAMWDSVSQAISGRYYGRKSRKADMDRLLGKYEARAKAAKSRDEFSDIVNAMIDEFKDSHFDFFTPADQGYYLMDSLVSGKSEMPNFGAWLRRTGDSYTVQMVLNGSEAEKAKLMKGDVIMTVDGSRFTPITSIENKVGKTVTLGVRRGSEQKDVQVQIKKAPASEMFLEATRDSARVIEHGGKKIGYLHIWTMMPNQAGRDVVHNALYGKLRDTDAMILDIRDGFGGRPEGYGDPFFRPEVQLEWKMGEVNMKQLFGYQRPLVVLINGGSRSAKEVFSYIMKKSKRAVLMGSTTAGHVLGTSPWRINEWSIIEIPSVEVVTDGVTLEGKGVTPHITIAKEFDANGKDLYITEALAFLTKK
jgi:carboxyl-terminal processing protease